jgi:hypothetical protein
MRRGLHRAPSPNPSMLTQLAGQVPHSARLARPVRARGRGGPGRRRARLGARAGGRRGALVGRGPAGHGRQAGGRGRTGVRRRLHARQASSGHATGRGRPGPSRVGPRRRAGLDPPIPPGGGRAAGRSDLPREPCRWRSFDPTEGLDCLRRLIAEASAAGDGIVVTGDVGITSHVGDLLRRAAIPARLARPVRGQGADG